MKHSMKKLTAILLAVAMVFSLVPLTMSVAANNNRSAAYNNGAVAAPGVWGFPDQAVNSAAIASGRAAGAPFTLAEALQILRYVVRLPSVIRPGGGTGEYDANGYWEYERLSPAAAGIGLQDALQVLRGLVSLPSTAVRRVCEFNRFTDGAGCAQRPTWVAFRSDLGVEAKSQSLIPREHLVLTCACVDPNGSGDGTTQGPPPPTQGPVAPTWSNVNLNAGALTATSIPSAPLTGNVQVDTSSLPPWVSAVWNGSGVVFTVTTPPSDGFTGTPMVTVTDANGSSTISAMLFFLAQNETTADSSVTAFASPVTLTRTATSATSNITGTATGPITDLADGTPAWINVIPSGDGSTITVSLGAGVPAEAVNQGWDVMFRRGGVIVTLRVSVDLANTVAPPTEGPTETAEPTTEVGPTTETTPDTTPGGTTDTTPDTTPGGTTDTTPDTTPGGTTDTTPDTTPGGTTDTTPDTTPGGTTDTTPDTTPGETTDTTPDTTPGGTTDTTPTTTPGTTGSAATGPCHNSANPAPSSGVLGACQTTQAEICRVCGYCHPCDWFWFGTDRCSGCDVGSDCAAGEGTGWCVVCNDCAACCTCGSPVAFPAGQPTGTCTHCTATNVPICETCSICAGCLYSTQEWEANQEPWGLVICATCRTCGGCKSMDNRRPC